MPETDIGSAIASDLSNAITDYSIAPQSTDGVEESDEYTYQMKDWNEHLGFYKEIPELQTAIDAKANWTMGAGFTADEPTTLLLDSFRGNGKDSFNSILSNAIRVYTIGGDSFTEIIRDNSDKNKPVVNLKPLDPSSMRIVFNRKGIVKRYEQITKTKNKKAVKKFKTNEILHLSRKRLADESHGISVVPSVKWIILARNEAMADWKRVLHRNVEPMWIFHLDTDDTNKIAAFKSKMDQAHAEGENMYIPKGTVVPEIVSTAQNSTLNPLNWINQLNDYFFQAVNVPQIIIGNAKEFTDASGKIVYLSYEQSVKGEQLYIEEQIRLQLNLEIQLTFPASLQQDLISGEAKDPMTSAAAPNDLTAELEGQK